MKTFNRLLCVMLSILMVMSCFSAVAFAADSEEFTSTLKAHTGMSNANSAKVTLDMVDEALKKANINEEISVIGNIKFKLDLRSINALCNTLDSYDGLIKAVLFLDPLGLVLGDLKDLELGTWKNGLSRTGDDIRILSEFVEFIEANKNLIKKVCNGSIDLGVFADYVDVKTLLGADGVSGILKEALIGFVYDKDSAEFKTAYNKYKTDVDAFIYDELLPYSSKDYLPGIDLDASSKISDLLMDVYNVSFEKYIKNAISSLSFDFATAEYAELKKLDGIVKLDGKNFDFSGLTYDKNSEASLQDQVNTILGNYMKNIVPGYAWNFSGGYSALKANIEGSIKYVAEKSGIVKNAQSKTVEQIGVEIAVIVLKNGDFGAYETGLEGCDTLQEMATKLLINTAKEMKVGVNYSGNESYLVVIGDILASWAYDNFPFTDTNGKAYRPGGGKDVFEVANYVANYFLFDRAGAAVLGLSTSKTEDIFTKLDKLADYFGQNKSVNFNSKNFLLGTTGKKGILDCVFTLDIVGLLDLTAIPALNKAGNVPVVEFLYKTVQYFFNNWAGKTLFPAYQNKAFTNALSNDNIANMISVLLETLNKRNSAVITLLTYVVALSIEGKEKTDYVINSAAISDIVATGKALSPVAAVKAGGKALTQNTDFIVVTDSSEPGAATATIKGIGLYSGEITRSFNIKLGNVSSVSYKSTTSSVTLNWEKVPCADSYNVLKYNSSSKKYETVKSGITGTSYTVSGLASGGEYKFSVQAVDKVVGATTAKEITTYTVPSAISASGVKSTPTTSSIKLTWNKVTGATEYRIEQYASKKWTTVATVTGTSATISKLSAGTEYTFRITAIKKLSSSALASAATTVKAKTSLATPSSIKATANANTVTLSWAKVKNAENYVVEQYNGKNWVAIKTLTDTSYTVKKLSSATQYKFRVKATSSSYTASAYGNVTANTLPEAVKASGVKTSVTDSSVKLTWKKVTGTTHYKVEQYISKKWKTVATVTDTSATISKLSGYTNYAFRITALKKLSDGKYLASSPITVKAKTKLSTPSSLKATYTDTSITLTWSKVKNAQKYEVLRYTGGKWKVIKTVTGTSYKITGLKATTGYKLAVRALVVEGKKNVYGGLKTITQYTGLKMPASVKVSAITATSAKITWSKVSKATSYEVYAYIGGKWVKKGTTTKNTITLKGLPSGTKTKIRVRAAAKLGGKTVYGNYSATASVLTVVGKVTGLKTSVRKTSAITLTWKKTTGATGYEVYRLVNGKWKKLGTTTKTSFTDSKSLKRGTEYKYKVRAVQKINSKTTRYGAYSAQLKAKTTYIGTAK